MQVYLIQNRLTKGNLEEASRQGVSFVCVTDPGTWEKRQKDFGMQIDLEMELNHPEITKAEVNSRSLTGSFSIPDREDPEKQDDAFSFVLDGRGMVLIGEEAVIMRYLSPVLKHREWALPSLERFLYDFLENMIDRDLESLENSEKQLNRMEDEILTGEPKDILPKIALVRGKLLTMRTHYEQMLDIGQEFLENENGFFAEENLRYFDMFCARIMRLRDLTGTLREYAAQVRELYQSRLTERQNTIVSTLTIATVVFTPLTLVTGWYGMNFKNMPELDWSFGYPAVALLCVLISAGCIWFLKKKKWL